MIETSTRSLEFLTGGGEMGELIRNFNWDSNPLGPPEKWDASLKTCVRIMLNSQQPIWIGWGPQLIKLYNDAYIEIVRGKHPKALGQPAKEVWKEILHDIGPMLDSALKSGQGNYWQSQLLIMERSGFPEETYYTYSYTPVLDEMGKPAGILCYNTSDTEKILNQRALDTLSRLSSTLIGCTSEAEVYEKTIQSLAGNKKDFPFALIYKAEEDGKNIRLSNVSKQEKEVSEFPSVVFVDTEKENMHYRNISKAVLTNTVVHSLNNGRWKKLPKGEWDRMTNHFAHVPVKNRNRKLPHAILTVGLNPYRNYDEGYQEFVQLIADQISTAVNNALAYETERSRMEAMEELDKAKTQFFTNISHEFRTPITLLLGGIEEVLNDSDTLQKNRDRLGIASRNAMRLLRLVNSLLDFSRIEGGKQKAEYVPTNITELTKNLAANFRSVIEKAGLNFRIEGEEFSEPVYIDLQMWEKIVFNLLSNAFKYTMEGNITLTVTASDTHAVLKVSDTGVGIPKKELPHMFDRFHRIENSAGRTFEGTGIGLSLVKELVTLHGGEISVLSPYKSDTSEDASGSAFIVKIPFGKKHLPADKISEETLIPDNTISETYIDEALTLLGNQQSVNINSVKQESDDLILIVDDNADMRQYLQSVVSTHYRTETAVNGMDALHKINELKPSIVISDIMMPVIDGTQLVKEVKSNPATQQIPVILLTARAGQESRVAGYGIGADDYMVKPFSSIELLVRIKAQLNLRQKQQEILDNLEITQRKMQQIILQAPFTVVYFEGKDFVVKMANQKVSDIIDRKPEDLIGKSFFVAAPETKDQGYEEMLQTVMQTGKPIIGNESPLKVNKNGVPVEKYIDFVFEPVRDENNEVSGIMALGIDVTEKVLARKLVEASEENLRAKVEIRTRELNQQKVFMESVINNANEWIVVWDKDLRLSMINDSSAAALNRPKEELLGKTLAEIYPASKGSQQEADLYNAMKGEQINNPPFLSRSTGRWIQNYITPIRDEEDNIYAALAIAQDVTEIYTAQEDLKRSQEHFSLLFNVSPVAKCITRVEDAVITDVNPAWELLFHRTKDEVTGKSEKQMGLADDNLEPGETIYNGKEQRFVLPDGKIVYTHSARVKIVLDEIPCFLTAYFDITERKINEERIIESSHQLAQKNFELEAINKELESFNYVASHDLQEPLRKIQTFISLIASKDLSKEQEHRYFDKISLASKRMSSLINAVLTFSRISRQEEQFSEVNLNNILDDVLNDYELMIHEKGAEISSDHLPFVRANSLQMHQLFSNLISNSLKFTTDKPRIEIRVKEVAGKDIAVKGDIAPWQKYVYLTFRDNGIGFEPEHKDQIFTLFQRLHGRHEFAGTGVGLSIAKKIVEHHHGFITAESKPEEGTVFNVWLPA